MLITCTECGKEVSDKAFSCPNCGCPINGKAKQLKRQNTSKMRMPPNFGQIHKLSGNRRKPYGAYPPTKDYDLKGNAIPRPSLGFFKTYNEAYQCLVEFNMNGQVSPSTMVFSELFEEWFENKYAGKDNERKSAYISAYKHCIPILDMPIRDIRYKDLQSILENKDLGVGTLRDINVIFNQVFKYAMRNEYLTKNPAEYVQNTQNKKSEKGEPFSKTALKILWDNTQVEDVRTLLILIYSGMRIKELATCTFDFDYGFIYGGVKTEAGKNRTIPLHSLIVDFAKEFDQQNFDIPKYRTTLYKSLGALDILYESGKKHTPHDARHTFSYLADLYEVDELSKHLIMGHSLESMEVEKSVYGHRTKEQLKQEIEKIRKY